MTRNQLIKSIAKTTGVSKEDIAKVLEAEEDQVMQTIALEDTLKYSWGIIGGRIKAPMKAAGKVAFKPSIIQNHGWTFYKLGTPYIEWSEAAKDCEYRSPEEYFNLPAHKFTTAARMYRRDAELPELPEYDSLPETEVKKLCEEADINELKDLHPHKAHETLYKRDYRRRIAVERSIGWAASGFKPSASLELTEEDYARYGLEKPEIIQQDKVGFLLLAVPRWSKASYNFRYTALKYIEYIANKLNIHEHDEVIAGYIEEYTQKLKELKQPIPVLTDSELEDFSEKKVFGYDDKRFDPYALDTSKALQKRLKEQAADLLDFQERLQTDMELYED